MQAEMYSAVHRLQYLRKFCKAGLLEVLTMQEHHCSLTAWQAHRQKHAIHWLQYLRCVCKAGPFQMLRIEGQHYRLATTLAHRQKSTIHRLQNLHYVCKAGPLSRVVSHARAPQQRQRQRGLWGKGQLALVGAHGLHNGCVRQAGPCTAASDHLQQRGGRRGGMWFGSSIWCSKVYAWMQRTCIGRQLYCRRLHGCPCDCVCGRTSYCRLPSGPARQMK
jgi:hypothetical protein